MTRDRLRRAAETCASILVLPIVVAYRCHLVGYATAGLLLGKFPGFAGMFLRRAWYSYTLERCGRCFSVGYMAVIHDPKARMGDDVFIGHGARVGLVEIGNDVMIGDMCHLLSGMSQYGFMRRDLPMRKQEGVYTRIHIGEDCWIGPSCVLGSDVAAHTVISPGSVVNRRFDEWQILSGVPAEPIATRPDLKAMRAARQRRTPTG